MKITLLHTAEVHRATFDALGARIAPSAELIQHVRVDWLERAQGGVDDALRGEIAEMIADADGAVVCTCTTLGPIVTAFGAIRIDQPMMARAAAIGGKILMVFCAESTRGPSTDLLQAEIDLAGDAEIVPLFLGEFWPLFMAGEFPAFCAAIAGAVRFEIGRNSDVSCVVLAQASMAGASELLGDLNVPVLASPELALRAGLGLPD